MITRAYEPYIGQIVVRDLEPCVVLEIMDGFVTSTKPVREYYLDVMLDPVDPASGLTLREARRAAGLPEERT